MQMEALNYIYNKYVLYSSVDGGWWYMYISVQNWINYSQFMEYYISLKKH
jgi:hypothetical protein